MPPAGAKSKSSQQKKKRTADANPSAIPKAKKPAVKQPGQDHDDSSDEYSDESLSEAGSELVDCDLEFYDPKPQDSVGLKDLLQHLLDGSSLDLDQLTQTVIQQTTVGTVVKTAEDEDPLGVITVLNLKAHASLNALSQIKHFLHRGCPNKDKRAALDQAWEAQGTGLVLSERVYNCPPQLAAPLQQALFDEIKWATEDEPEQEQRSSFEFHRYIMLTRSFASATQQQAKPQKKRKKEKAPASLVYMRPEDEFFHKHCSWSFTFPVPSRPAGYEDMEQVRLCMMLTPDQAKSARAELDITVGNLAAAQ